jgi:hypothetical protein
MVLVVEEASLNELQINKNQSRIALFPKTSLISSHLCLVRSLNILKPSGNYMYGLLSHSVTLYFAHRVYVQASYDSAINSLNNIN